RRLTKDVQEPRQLRRHHRIARRNLRQTDVHSRRLAVGLLRTRHRPHATGNRRAQERSFVRQTASNGRKDETCVGSCFRISRLRRRQKSCRPFSTRLPRPRSSHRSTSEKNSAWVFEKTHCVAGRTFACSLKKRSRTTHQAKRC